MPSVNGLPKKSDWLRKGTVILFSVFFTEGDAVARS